MATKKWTVLIYLAGDNDLDEDGARDIGEMAKVGSNDDVNVVAQFDRAGTVGTQRFYITKGGGYPDDSIADLGETNTGDPGVLIDFLKWGITTYPAEHYMVVLWNHGSGWNEDEVYDKAVKLSPEKDRLLPTAKRTFREAGIKKALFSTTIEEILKQKAADRAILYDDESKDFLDNMEMKNVLTETAKLTPEKRFDILGFDACLMNTIEVAYQLKDTAKIILGSEETEPSAGWPYDKVIGAIAADPDKDPGELCKEIVDSYIKSYDTGENSEPVTLSAVNTGKIGDALSAIDKWAAVLKKNMSDRDTFYSVLSIIDEIQKFYYPTYKDLYDFARLLNERSKSKDIKDSSKAVMDILAPGNNNFIVASKYLTQSMANAHGITIYFPGRQSYLKYYDRLDFAKKSRWNEFLKAYQKAYDKPWLL
ncbi:MAG: clostripain-related cysteine peptidase [Candidatus Methanoperedens sp.]|nr:clostripain-related cysteine peptidase [Candidatus Methanoperedens sp.]MCZ7361499.1 clostripain-related cysteine peptidase [Candidatus Methanoperedens sp.]HLB70441.1 clostripain-related cysteine peptidase [Candidatus Methanoperedens sp.]